MGQEEYREISSFLRRFAHRSKLVQGAEGICLIGTCALLLFALGLGIREISSFFPYAPVLYSLLTAAILFSLLALTLFQCSRRFSLERAALDIEKRQPHLRNNLINSLQLYPQLADEGKSQGISAAMVFALLRTTKKQLQAIQGEALIRTERIKARLRFLALLFAPVLAVVLLHPSSVGETFALLIHPLKDLPGAQTRIDVVPKGARVLRGSPVTIQATAWGTMPASMELILWSGKEDGKHRVAMEQKGGGQFTVTIAQVEKNLQYRVAAAASSSPWYGLEAIDPPEIGNLKFTLYPPHYTGLPTQILEGGNIEGIKGSNLRLAAQSTKEILKARVVLDDGREVPLRIEGKSLHGNLVLLQSQKYEILVEDALGFGNSPIPYEIRVRSDGFPTIELLNPTQDLQVNGDEILPLEFSARDDFGIQEIALAIRVGDRQERLPIQREGNKRFILREQFHWDLGKLGPREGEEVTYHLEALDNDTISGPKLGVSRSLRLRLKNLKREHQEVAAVIRDLPGRLVDLLADHLEQQGKTPRSDPQGQRLEQKLDEVMRHIEEALQQTEKDRLSDFATWSDLEALKRNLRFTKEELLKRSELASSAEEKARLHDEISSELERMSLLSEEIAKRLNAQEVAATAQELMKSQERLLDSLERLKSGDKNLDAVLKEISRLAQLLGSLQQALAQSATSLPDEFVNSEALRGLGLSEMFSALEEIRKKLMQGDIEGAMQMARELFHQLASMVAALQGAHQSALSSTMRRMQGEMMRSASELEQIARAQQEILVETEGMSKERLQERAKALKERLDRFQARAQEGLARLAELFPDEERESARAPATGENLDEATLHHLMKNMIARLLQKDFPGLAEVMEMARKELRKKAGPGQGLKRERAEASLQGLKADLDSLLEGPDAAPKEETRKRLRDLAHQQGLLQERTEELHEKLDPLFQLFPTLDPKITKNIQEAAPLMGKAQNRLSGLDAQGAVPPERGALERLTEAQRQMQNSMERLAQRGQLGHMPVTYLLRRGRFLPTGRLIPLPGMAELPEFDVKGGMTGLDMERFRLPGAEDYKVPRSFREEILESLKQGVPPQLKEQIESYFKNLSE